MKVADDAIRECRESIAKHSKSFNMASRLLPPRTADRASVLYAWCRRVDDAVDLAPPADRAGALARLRRELDEVYASESQRDLTLRAFTQVVQQCSIPRVYGEELLAGMAMDVEGIRYTDEQSLLLYCYRVAGVVGLMMCHVLELRDARAMRQAAHLGLAMQLTNICRDVLEDWDLGRLYLPENLLTRTGAPALRESLGRPFPRDARQPASFAVRELLRLAQGYYRSADTGIQALPVRCGFAVRSASRIYEAIGSRLLARDADVTGGRVFVPTRTKLGLIARASLRSLSDGASALRSRSTPLPSLQDSPELRFPEDILLPCS